MLLSSARRPSCHPHYTENRPRSPARPRIVAAAGAPALVKGSWVKPGAVVIDVGITRIMGPDGKEKLVGDVAFGEVGHAKAVTPVPGGVGPMTIACLLHNTVQAAKAQAEGPMADTTDPFFDAPDRSLIYALRRGAKEYAAESLFLQPAFDYFRRFRLVCPRRAPHGVAVRVARGEARVIATMGPFASGRRPHPNSPAGKTARGLIVCRSASHRS